MSILVDTNVLLRRMQLSHPDRRIAKEAVATLIAQGETVHYTPQNIAEFWNVATRPVASNGLGLEVDEVSAEIEKIERALTILPNTPAVYGEWRRLVVKHAVHGVKVHDASLVAAMNVHGVRRLMTFDAGDFARYAIEVVHPSTLVA